MKIIDKATGNVIDPHSVTIEEDDDTQDVIPPKAKAAEVLDRFHIAVKGGRCLDRENRHTVSAKASTARLQWKLKAEGDGDDPGFIQGYASVWDTIDSDNEVIRKGAFAKTIVERVDKGKVPLMVEHYAWGGGTMDVIGKITQAKEDQYGLWIHAELASTTTAQEAKKLMAEGMVKGLSVSFNPLQWGFIEDGADDNKTGRTIVEFKEARLLEVTLTPLPANEDAAVMSVKGISKITEEMKALTAKDQSAEALEEDISRILDEAFGGTGRLHEIAKRFVEIEAMCKRVGADVTVEPDPNVLETADVSKMRSDIMARKLAIMQLGK